MLFFQGGNDNFSIKVESAHKFGIKEGKLISHFCDFNFVITKSEKALFIKTCSYLVT